MPNNVDYRFNLYKNGIKIDSFPHPPGIGWRNYSIADYSLIGNWAHTPTINFTQQLGYDLFDTDPNDSATFLIEHILPLLIKSISDITIFIFLYKLLNLL